MLTTFLFMNIGGDLESIAQRVKEEGYPVLYYKTKGQVKGREDTGVGIFDKSELIDDFWEQINKYDIDDIVIMTDDNGQGALFDHLRMNGWKVLGGSNFGDDLEYKRDLGTKLMGKIGLGLPEEHDFNNFNDGIKFLETQDPDSRWVFKPNGEDFAGSAKTYTGKNTQDLMDFIEWLKHDVEEKHYTIAKFILQEFIPGIEADFEAMFNGDKFMEGSVAIDIEEKKSGDGNKGEAVGCMGNIELYVAKCRFFDEYMVKLAPILKRQNYVGPVSINCIFSNGEKPQYKEGMPFGLEFTTRFGWDATLTQMALIKDSGGSIAEWILSIVNQLPYKFPHKLVGCGIRAYTGSISLKKDDVAGRRFSFDESITDNLYFYSISHKKDSYIIEDNPVLVCNTTGKNLKQTISECYNILNKKVNIPDVYYRMEIGERAEKVLRFLRKYDWI